MTDNGSNGSSRPNLELDLLNSKKILEKVSNEEYAFKLYSAMCNMRWKHESCEDPEDLWSCTWRYSGGILATLRNVNESYMDFYCHGNEGFVDPEIADDLKEMGWSPVPWPRH